MSQHHHHQFDPKFRRFHGFLMVYHLILSFLRAIRIAFKRMRRGMMRSLLRVWMKLNRQDRYGRAGFVLPTVTMVLLVVVLLSVTIMLRSMDRSKMAQYRRVDEAVLQAATPALDRAKAKIKYLLSDPNLPTRATPSDTELYRALKESSYNLADETQLQVRYAANGTINVNEDDNTPLENRTTIATAWKFPVDTDNNGKFDTWTIYGIYFRNPINTNTARNPLDARTPPYTATSNLKSGCQVEGTSSGLVGGGWYPVGSKLQKAIFTYVVNVPIAESEIAGWNTAKYDGAGAEAKATTAISALEYQQDVTRIPLNNNAVVYRDDLELSPGGGPFFRLNGRVMTNSNLMVTQYSGLAFFLVSAPGSCFFEDPENSKIIVGGEVINGVSAGTASGDSNDVGVHLFQGPYVNPLNPNKTQQITDAGANNRTVTDNSLQVLSNSQAYEDRLSYLVSKAPTTLLNEITDPIKRNKALRTYFEDRVRKVPYKEVDFNGSDTMQDPVVSGTVVKPPNTWIYPSNIDNNSGGKNAKVDDTAAFNKLTPTGTTTAEYRMQASNPDGLSIENNLGDRILVGNGLPLKWYINEQEQSGSTPQFLFAGSTPIYWTGTTEPRYRQTRVQELPDVGSTDRDGFWEIAAGTTPKTADDPYGGLRIVTGAGIYSRNNSFLPPPKLDVSSGKVIAGAYQTSTSQTNPIVWPDTMPMSVAEPRIVPPNNTKIGGSKIFDNSGLYDADGLTPLTTLAASTKEAGDGERWKNQDASSPTKGDLQMRATVVYHYAQSSFSQELNQEANSKGEWTNVKQTPIACVSSYYDPSTALTAKNMESLRVDKLDATGNIEKDPTGQVITLPAWNTASKGRSNNGIVYGPPPAEGSYSTALSNQAKLVFPDGRWVNPTLRDALAATTRTLSQQAAVDATLCAYGILDGTLKPLSNPPIPHGAIRETAFLDARQIKATEQDNTTTTNVDETFTIYQENPQTKATLTTSSYKLPLEHRQPLEIRATILDIFQLRTQQIAQTTSGPTKGGKEYLLPLSGIVYASRDDALPDSTGANIYASSTDSWVDPTRRPNGIMLINGKCLARDTAGSCNPALTGGNNEEKIQAITREKGLTLVSNLPVYIKGQFNPHTQEEFKTALAADWGNFYTRSTSAIGKTASTITKADRNLNENFACRPGDPRLPGCTAGDSWRPATILADAVTVLSGSTTTAADTQGTNLNAGFRFGFRNEGDFDLRNNAGVARTGYDLNADGSIKHIANLSSLPATQKPDYDEAAYDLDLNGDGDRTDLVQEYEVTAKAARMINGFDGYNNFVTNGLTSRSKFDTDDNGTVAETYQDSNYTVAGGLNSSYFNNFVTPVQRRSEFPDYVMELCRKPMVSACSPRDWVIGLDVEGVVFKEVTSNGTTPPVSPVVSQTNKIIFDYPTTGPNPAQFTNTDNPTTTGVLPSDLDSYQLAVLLAAGKATVKETTKQIQYNLYDWKENQNSTQQGIFIADKFLAGTTSRPARFVEDQGFPRRISFFRYANGKLLTNSSGQPVSIGMAPKPTGNSSTSNNQDEQHDILSCFVVDGNSLTLDFDTVGADVLRGSDANGNKNANQKQQCSNATPRIRSTGNGLWFRTVASNNSMSFDAQRPLWLYNPATPGTRKVFQTPNGTATRTIQNPLLAPVLQIAMTTGTPASTTTNLNVDNTTTPTSWLMIADNGPANNGITPYDVVVGTGDVPSRKLASVVGDFNGGLPNLARLLENWQNKTVKISGSFIQFQRSKYATAPYFALFKTTNYQPPAIFHNGPQFYTTSSTAGQTPYFSQPRRNWGFDVGLLSQSPDLFAQKLTTRSSDSEPAEYFREVGRSDEWVKTLLCAKEADGTTNAVYDGDPNKDDTIRPTSFCKSKTGG